MSFHLFKKNRRNEVRSRAMTPNELATLEHLPYYCALPPHDQLELQNHIKVFLSEKQFVGAQDFEITEAMQVAIAAHACVLLLHRETDYFPRIDSIIVYESTFVSQIKQSAGANMVTATDVARVGESNADTGVVVLAWDRVAIDLSHINSGSNVVFHEFAHQLDAEDGGANGAPKLPNADGYKAWAKILGKEYNDLDAAIKQHQNLWIDPYANTNPAEFFAVVTEMFFTAPKRMRNHSPELYKQFCDYFQQDPAEYI